jgi:hypothetical protein
LRRVGSFQCTAQAAGLLGGSTLKRELGNRTQKQKQSDPRPGSAPLKHSKPSPRYMKAVFNTLL